MHMWVLRIKILTHNILKITNQELPIALVTSKIQRIANNEIHSEIIRTDYANHFLTLFFIL